MVNYNAFMASIAQAQGIEIGSAEWVSGGLHPFSGQTGGHPAYGWYRPEPMTEARARAVISNYAARPVYYSPTDHPAVSDAYRMAGRPVGWSPVVAEDADSGERIYMTSNGVVLVSGPDVAHFWIDPLLDVIDRGAGIDIAIDNRGNRCDAAALARGMAIGLMDCLAGQVRTFGHWWSGGGRHAARVIDAFVQGHRRGVVSKDAMAAFWSHLSGKMLPFLESAPAVEEPKGQGTFNIYQDLSWVLPAVYDLRREFTNVEGDSAGVLPRLEAIQQRLAHWILDIDDATGRKRNGAYEWVRITDAIRTGEDGKALPTLDGAITADDVGGEPWYGLWAIRAADIAARVLPGDHANDYRRRVLDAWGTNPKADARKWVADADRRPIEWVVL